MLASQLAFLAAFLAPPSNTDRAAVLAAEARVALEAASQREALAKAEEALEWSPEDAALLELASRAAEADKEPDRALCYAALALELASAPEQAPLAESLKARIAVLDPLAGKDQALLGDYASALCVLGGDCAAHKLWVNAVALYSRSQGSRAAATAEAALSKIYDNKKAVEALLDSGLDVPIKPRKRRANAAKQAVEDKLHSSWEKAWEVKGSCYTIRTDLPLELAEQMLLAMEQMNAFYRKVFHVKEHGGDTARVTISVYKSRREFDEHENRPDADIAGFFVPNQNRVATYDPRADGRPLSELWSTLFHESSHQFTHLISADTIPAWLNEGTASYFEGARLLPNASVETNLVPEERLAYLPEYFEAGEPKLEEVVRYFEPGSYDADYYPFGWGLVYFLLNYENDKSQRIYEPLYRDYMAAYKSGGKHDVFGRFVDFFVTKAKDPAVKNFADFEARWRKWILAQHELYFGPPEVADTLIARGRKQRADKQPDAAIESFRAALRKRPGDLVANFELGETLAAQKLADAALYHFQKCVQSVRALRDDSIVPPCGAKKAAELAADAAERVAKLDKLLAEKLAAAESGFAAGAAGTAKAYVEKGLPLYALRFLARAETAFGGSRELAELRAKLASDAAIDPRRWHRLPLEDGLLGWQASEDFALDGDDIVASKDGGFCWAEEERRIPYRFEARIEQKDSQKPVLVGLMFGANSESDSIQAVLIDGKDVLLSSIGKKGWSDDDTELGKWERKKACTLAIEVRETEVEVFVDGTSVGKKEYEAKDLAGVVGLFAEGPAVFRELRVKE